MYFLILFLFQKLTLIILAVSITKIVMYILLALLLFIPFEAIADTITLTKNGPLTAREGDLIEYRLNVVNESNMDIDNVRVLDTLPTEVDFVEAMSTHGGLFEPSTGTGKYLFLVQVKRTIQPSCSFAFL